MTSLRRPVLDWLQGMGLDFAGNVLALFAVFAVKCSWGLLTVVVLEKLEDEIGALLPVGAGLREQPSAARQPKAARVSSPTNCQLAEYA